MHWKLESYTKVITVLSLNMCKLDSMWIKVVGML